MPHRSYTADLLKGVAVVLMIQVHIVELFATPEIFESQTGKILLFLGGPLCAPIFMVVFGYYIAQSKKTSKQLIFRGFKIFLTGMLLNLLLNFNLLFHIAKGKINMPVLPYIFGVDILQLAGLSLILIAVLKKLLDKSFYIPLVLSFIAAYLGHLLLDFQTDKLLIQHLGSYFYGLVNWSFFPVFPWIAYPLLGIAFYQYNNIKDIQQLLKPSVLIIFGTLSLAFLSLSIPYAIEVSSNLQEYYHHGIDFFGWTATFMVIYSTVIYKIGQFSNNYLFQYLKWLGQHVTIVYIIQWILIGNIATIIYKSVASTTTLLLSFIGIMCTVSVCTYWYLNYKQKNKV